MTRPLFSCVVPVKGARPYLEEALSSLRGQGLGDGLEIILQDGDAEPDAGQSDALNKGFARARGAWLFWLNADDVLLPGALPKVADAIGQAQSRGAAWIAGNTIYIDAAGRVADARRDARWRPWFRRRYTTWTGGPGAFFSRALWARRGGFDASLRYMMDIDLWTRWARAGERFFALRDYLWGFRIHAGSLTTGQGRKDAYWAERERLWARHGLTRQWFWLGLSRAAQLLDGSYLRRRLDRARLRGKPYTDL